MHFERAMLQNAARYPDQCTLHCSRMESNGVPGKIHVSKSTADELLSRGKQSWLTVREEKIVAKGKGEMIKSVNYDAIQSLLIESIKEQQKQIEELKAEIASLKG